MRNKGDCLDNPAVTLSRGKIRRGAFAARYGGVERAVADLPVPYLDVADDQIASMNTAAYGGSRGRADQACRSSSTAL
jgi:hypothetical protein